MDENSTSQSPPPGGEDRDALPPASNPARLKKPSVKIDQFVRKHSSAIDVQRLRQRGLTTINCLTLSKINELVAVAVAKAFQKYQAHWSRQEAARIESEARAELQQELERLRTANESESARAAADAKAWVEMAQSATRTIEERLHELFASRPKIGGSEADAALLERRLLDIVDDALTRAALDAADAPPSEAGGVDPRSALLERRIARLKEHVEHLERALGAIDGRRAEDPGLPSIHRQLPGLSAADRNYDKKKSLLKGIFEDNLKLQWKTTNHGQAVH
jgi:hypothetical protein